MRKIHQIKIKNFKAFQKEQVFDLKGKNILAYGNNGSGKSSLFWALYTMTQSSIKNDAEIQKYFKVFNNGDNSTYQSLRNVFTGDDDNAYIELITIDENSKKETYTISLDTINTNEESDTIIQELNQASDFINYKLLHNFYAATHKQEINLWPVFERDIFPFLLDDANHVLLDAIRSKTEDVDRTPTGLTVRGKKKDIAEQKIAKVNNEITSLLNQIQVNANDFIKKHFFDGKDVVRVSLDFIRGFTFENVQNKLWRSENDAVRHNKLQIKLFVELYQQKSGEWKPVHRVQSFLNEAQLTRIAIGIRIGALRTRVQTTDFKILVLDDMLISLDMSNRMPIVKMILNKDNDPDLHFFDQFQKIILTHDKGFYELIKRHTSSSQWEYYNFHAQEDENTAPTIKNDRDSLEKAQAYLADGEYEASGNELRKKVETLLVKYINQLNSAAHDGEFEALSNQLNNALTQVTATSRKDFEKVFVNKDLSLDVIKKLQTDYANDGSLTPNEKGRLTGLKKELIAYLIKQYELKDNKTKLIEETQDILKRVMNPASHATLIPLYESELKDAIAGVKQLQEYLNTE